MLKKGQDLFLPLLQSIVLNRLQPDAAARVITRAIAKEKKEVLVGRKELLMVYIKRFFPGLCATLARKIKPM